VDNESRSFRTGSQSSKYPAIAVCRESIGWWTVHTRTTDMWVSQTHKKHPSADNTASLPRDLTLWIQEAVCGNFRYLSSLKYCHLSREAAKRKIISISSCRNSAHTVPWSIQICELSFPKRKMKIHLWSNKHHIKFRNEPLVATIKIKSK
jgi:hypothetical protein